ncbi:MAG: HAMP domain-containing histidine kinase [Sulfuritalea sp.]|jgi:signal transduction histidine kinase|nr:HAMP domain-containing histidine kinase [Sulfuritalea sp.]
MHLPHDLRGRVALFFAGFGAIGSLTMAGALYQGAHDLGQRLIDETLSAELDDYIARRERNPTSMPPSTVVVHGYVQGAAGADEVPAYLTRLPAGNHDIRLGTVSYRVAIVERGGARYYLLHDTALQARREQRFAWMLGLLAVTMTLLSALGGVWVSRTVVAPVTDLAAKVRHRRPSDWEHPLADDFPVGEVGELARVFDRHLIRMRAFIERERVFSADISHELRTALAVILSATEILLEDNGLSDKQKTRIGRIKRAADDMAELGSALLLMAHEEHSLAAGDDCVLAEVVREVVAEQRHMLGGKPVEVEVHTNPELILDIDAGLVRILVSNLIRNAFSYTAAGSVVVRQDAHSLTVSDTGSGIPAHAIDRVFIRHFRGMTSEGAGIGLSLVKRICDRYGWRVRLESKENQGTVVTVDFS